MTVPRFDLDRYLARIGYTGPRTPTLDTLRGIHLRHPQAIPFENLDPLLGRAPELELPNLEAKLVRGGRGGYCFEHNLLLRHALEALGFRVTGLGGRVVYGAPPDVMPARTHMLLRVELAEGTYIADVGFGGFALTAPLRLVGDVEQATPHEPFRLATIETGYQLEIRLADAWQALYWFDLHEQHPIDYKVANWFVATNPWSIFVTGIRMARVDGERRFALRNTEFSVYHLGSRTDHRTVESVDDLKQILRGPFRLVLPDHPDLDAVLARVLLTPMPRDRIAEERQSKRAAPRDGGRAIGTRAI
jgi:N-hydroxyarylamine O-acetyltransferase